MDLTADAMEHFLRSIENSDKQEVNKALDELLTAMVEKLFECYAQLNRRAVLITYDIDTEKARLQATFSDEQAMHTLLDDVLKELHRRCPTLKPQDMCSALSDFIRRVEL